MPRKRGISLPLLYGGGRLGDPTSEKQQLGEDMEQVRMPVWEEEQRSLQERKEERIREEREMEEYMAQIRQYRNQQGDQAARDRKRDAMIDKQPGGKLKLVQDKTLQPEDDDECCTVQ